MASHFRILNATLNPKARIHHALQKVYGVGSHQANRVLSQIGVHPDTKVEALYNDMDNLRALMENRYPTRTTCERKLGENIMTKIKMNSYVGQRHLFGLPVHGQKTRTNRKSNRRVKVLQMRSMKVPLFREVAKKQFRGRPNPMQQAKK